MQARRSWESIETNASHAGVGMTMSRCRFRNELPNRATFSGRRRLPRIRQSIPTKLSDYAIEELIVEMASTRGLPMIFDKPLT
jgi:hypothetical protein